MKFKALQMVFEMEKTLDQHIYFLSFKTKIGFLMFKPYISLLSLP
jgi:hypothetical protein